MKIKNIDGYHCFYWGKNGYWMIGENDVANFKQMVAEWRAESDEEVDYNFCYTELLGYFQLDSWNRIPEKKQQRIIEYLIQQV